MQQRLFEVLWYLTRHKSATAAELAQRFGVSRRTIYRDVDALSGAGIPVYTERGKAGGIHLLPDFVLDKTHFTLDEQAQLVAHFESLNSLGTPDTSQVLDKLGAMFGQAGARWLEVDFAPWDGGEEMRVLFRLLRDAILKRHIVCFVYIGIESPPQEREVEPYRVVFRGQGWYLHGFCRLRGAFRFFKLNRMQNTVDTAQPYVPDKTPPPPDTPYAGTATPVVLRFGAEMAFRVRDEFPPEAVQQTPQGDYIVVGEFPDGNWLHGYLLSFGPAAEVLAPPRLRRQMAAMLAEMTAQYESPSSDTEPLP